MNLQNNQDIESATAAARNIINSPNVVCECGSKLFVPAVVLKRVSQIISPTGKEEILDIPVYMCAKCGQVPSEFRNKANYSKIFGEEDQPKTIETGK